MKHEAMARALSQLDDDLITEAEDYAPPSRRRRYFPRVAALAACFALVLAAALNLSHPKADIYLGETLLGSGGVIIEAPMPLALDARSVPTQALSIPLRLAFGDESAHTVSVSDGALDSPIDSFPRALSERTAKRGSALFTWQLDEPDCTAVYTLSLDGEAAMTLRYDETDSCWHAERA